MSGYVGHKGGLNTFALELVCNELYVCNAGNC